MGGADSHNVTVKVLHALNEIREHRPNVIAVLGACNPNRSDVVQVATKLDYPVEILDNVADMAAVMRHSDLAVAAGGSTLYELAACGVPTVSIVIADNQAAVARSLAARGAIINLGPAELLSNQQITTIVSGLIRSNRLRQILAANARRLVDGRGADRVAADMIRRMLSIRPAVPDDAALLFHWQNDPLVRKASFSSGPVDFEQHRRWLVQRCGESDSCVYVIEFPKQMAVGCVRFSIELDVASVSMNLDAAFRGRRLSSHVLDVGIWRLTQDRPDISTIEAFIKPDNEASRRSFATAGFVEQDLATMMGQDAQRWTLELRKTSAYRCARQTTNNNQPNTAHWGDLSFGQQGSSVNCAEHP